MNRKKIDKILPSKKKSERKLVSRKAIAPTLKKCNASVIGRDGYCEKPGISPGLRCRNHHGNQTNITPAAKELYEGALRPEQSQQLESLIKDVHSMEGEIALQKIELIESKKMENTLNDELMKLLSQNLLIPEPVDYSKPDDIVRFELEKQTYETAVKANQNRIKELKLSYKDVTKRVQLLLEQITKSVERNSKMVKASEYSFSLQQLMELLSIQSQALEDICVGCPKLRQLSARMSDIKLKGAGNIAELSTISERMQFEDEVDGQFKEAKDVESQIDENLLNLEGEVESDE